MDAKDYATIMNIMAKYAPADGGAGKAEVVKKTPAKKAAKVAAGEEEEVKKNTDGKRDVPFPPKEKSTLAILELVGIPADIPATKRTKDQVKEFNKTKDTIKKYINDLTDADFDAKSLEEHKFDWINNNSETDDEAEDAPEEEVKAEEVTA
jgi:hypothetical protein